eukprot:TRINITY_DN35708_c0_g1_i1.p1 TRINITY_DN35708_c0_g1~~TRINITY_DN35708_c0_g1_i1.p1  ORF type:complete len:350 (+),score=31.90 TRINITY_DN35708_c0_g1_i1:2-1051(+)
MKILIASLCCLCIFSNAANLRSFAPYECWWTWDEGSESCMECAGNNFFQWASVEQWMSDYNSPNAPNWQTCYESCDKARLQVQWNCYYPGINPGITQWICLTDNVCPSDEQLAEIQKFKYTGLRSSKEVYTVNYAECVLHNQNEQKFRSMCSDILGTAECSAYANTFAKVDDVNFIFMFDSSQSMAQGQLWTALGYLYNHLILPGLAVGANNLVSLVEFSSDAYLEYQQITPEEAMTKAMKFYGRGTNFQKPMKMTNSLLGKIQPSSKVAIFFLSDGTAYYPSVQVPDMKSISSEFKEFYFFGLGINNPDSAVLQQIATGVGGSYYNVGMNDLPAKFMSLLASVSTQYI